MTQTLATWSFDSQSAGVYGWQMQLTRKGKRAYGCTYTPSGVEHHSRANYVEKDTYSGAGILPSDIFMALRTKHLAGTSGSLVTTEGSVTANIVELEGTPAVGVADADDHLYQVRIVFQVTA